MDVKEIQEKIKAANIDSLRIDFPDLHGICRSKLVPARRLEEMLEFFETMTSGYEQIRGMKTEQLKKLVKLGGKLQKLLGI